MQITEFKKSDTFEGDYYSHIKGFENTLLHKHEYFEFFFVSVGTCIHLLNERKNTLTIGDAFLLVPGDIHTFIRPKNESNFTHRDIVFSMEFFKSVCDSLSPCLYKDILHKKYQLSFHLTSEQTAQIESYIIPITIEKDSTTQKMLQTSLANYILNIILLNSFKYSSSPNWLTKLLSFFNDPAQFKIPLSEIVNRFNFNYSYMCREFKKYTGMTMSQYFNKQKIVHARSLLQCTQFSIEEISEITGINSASYFHRLFKKYYGISPDCVRHK